MLAQLFHYPVRPTGIFYETRDPSRWIDVDARHLRISFTGPPSGKVLVSIQAPGGSGFGVSVGYWALRGGGGRGPDRVVPGSARFIYGEAGLKQLQDCYQVILDVEPGREYEWTFAFRPGNEYGTSIKIGKHPPDPIGHGPVLMEVWDTELRTR